MSRVLVSLDEGGLRRSEGDAHEYLPYEGIADVELRTRTLRQPAVIALDAAGGERVVFVGPEALEIHGALVEHLASRRAHAPAKGLDAWRRGARPLVEWLAALDASSAGGYRDDAAPLAHAHAALDDANADVEARAAAAYLLVRFGDDADLARAAKILLGRALPPLVLAAARLAEGGAALVDDARIADAAPFLAPADRVMPEAAHASDRHAAAAERARHELAADAQPGRPREKARRAISGTDRDTSRWIGKSWGL